MQMRHLFCAIYLFIIYYYYLFPLIHVLIIDCSINWCTDNRGSSVVVLLLIFTQKFTILICVVINMTI